MKKGKLLTVRFEIVDEVAANVFWDAFGSKVPKAIFGMIPWAAGWGDEFKERDFYKLRYEMAKELIRGRSYNHDAMDILERLERMDSRRKRL
jgi:hypothetical protein